MGATGGVEIAIPSRTSELIPSISGLPVAEYWAACVVHCRPLMVFFFWSLYCLSTASDYPLVDWFIGV